VIATGAVPIEASAAPAVPAIARIGLQNFRSYAALQLDIAPAPVVLAGPNGAGKTNLLEALSFLAPGRGMRRD
jgi:DNA replication and repair protein RecF